MPYVLKWLFLNNINIYFKDLYLKCTIIIEKDRKRKTAGIRADILSVSQKHLQNTKYKVNILMRCCEIRLHLEEWDGKGCRMRGKMNYAIASERERKFCCKRIPDKASPGDDFCVAVINGVSSKTKLLSLHTAVSYRRKATTITAHL